MRDPIDPALEEAQAAEQARKAELRRKREIDDLKWLMAHAQGRRFICRLLEESGVFRTSFHTSGSVAAFNEGRKHIGYVLTGEMMELVPDAYVRMLKEFQRDD